MVQDREQALPDPARFHAPRYHRPVLTREVVEVFRPVTPGVLVDATFGGGGHTTQLQAVLGETWSFIALDKDPAAVVNASGKEVRFFRSDFRDLSAVLVQNHPGPISGVLFDLGVSSHQIGTGNRGFSFRQPGPLDMRMDPSSSLTAAQIINVWPAADLQRIFIDYGEEPNAARIASAIVKQRPLTTTIELAEVIATATPARQRWGSRHPARRVFQALRIAVNDELTALRAGLDQALARLSPGGRCAVISYHSLEDRIVKQRFAQGRGECVCPPEMPVCGCGKAAELRELNPKPIFPSDTEIFENPRSRSARLRAVEKI